MTASRDLGLYIHIPFCRQRCHFCAFYLEIARTERMDSFRSALAHEMDLYRRQNPLRSRPLHSIYFGGGTPTAMPPGHLLALLDLVRATWLISPGAEITVEAHPSTVTAEALKALADAGFTRISFGVESMNDKDFALIGRPGRVQDAETAVEAARAAGFTNINLDVMYGLPEQSLNDWIRTLRSLLALAPSHVSCYALTVEEGSRLSQDIARRLVSKPDEELQVDMESVAEAMLSAAGFVRYEISNYARPGATCRHNLLYWTDQNYLGLGPSAQSYVDGVRFGNIADLTGYVDRLKESRLPITEHTVLSAPDREADALVFGLRLLRGVPLNAIQSPERRQKVQELVGKGLLESDTTRVRLTALGRRYADSVAGELF